MSIRLFSPKELASMFHVNESTVKRWTDAGLIHCFKTPGGHRKYRPQDVHAFLERHEYETSDLSVLSFDAEEEIQVRFAAMERQYTILTDIYHRYAIEGDRDKIFELLSFLYSSGLSFPLLCDEVIRPVMHRIGTEWEKGELTIDREHLASYATADAITRLQMVLHREIPHSQAVVFGTVNREMHEIPLLCARIVLEIEGWKTFHVGSNLPLVSLLEAVAAHRPGLVCLSSTISGPADELISAIDSLHLLTSRIGARLIIGGQGMTQDIQATARFDFHAPDMSGLAAYIQRLRNGGN